MIMRRLRACHVERDTPPTAHFSESWNVMPAVQPSTVGSLNAATSTTSCCRSSRDKIHDNTTVCGRREEKKVRSG